jgi:isoaspartyl peptidase/L-asparaginase-like protein (Ntn-hydrolase superfamily)
LLFAKSKGAPLATDEELKAEKEKQALAEGLHDTVGAVALDSGGNLAAGTSTGGLNGQKVGRIGDSPLPGGGFMPTTMSAPSPFPATARRSPAWRWPGEDAAGIWLKKDSE